MTIDYNQLTKQQKDLYDNWLKVPGHSAEDQQLLDLIGFIRQPKTRVRHAKIERDENIRREAELVLKHLERGVIPEIKVCKWCELKFAADYKYMQHCSDDCLKQTLLSMGLPWNPAKTPAERWGTTQVPSVISPPALERLMPVFESIAAKTGTHGKLPVLSDLDDPFANI